MDSIKNNWYDIMLNMNHWDIIEKCNLNSYTSSICNNSSFWKEKTLRDFNITPDEYDNIAITYNFKYPDIVYVFLLTMKTEDVSYGSEMFKTINKCLKLSLKIGNLRLVKHFISKSKTSFFHVDNYNDILLKAAKYGHINIVELMLDYGADDYNGCMAIAAKNCHINIVKLMLYYGANNYNKAMKKAAIKDCVDIVQLMLYYGANNYDGTMNVASEHGAYDVIRMMLNASGNDRLSCGNI